MKNVKTSRKLEWIKFDLHHHTGEDTKAKGRNESNFNYEKILKVFNEKKVKLIAITNHNKISEKSIKTYEKIIQNNKYEIKILPGIELEFKMKSSKEKGHLVLIFSDDYKNKLSDLEKFFDDKQKYNPESNKTFTKYFPIFINELNNEGFKKFIIMPHFDKSSNCIDYETISDPELTPWLNSFDILEGKIINDEAVKLIEKSFKFSKFDEDKAIYIGTDAHNTNETIENLTKISYILTEPTYEGLEKMVDFPKTRISRISEKEPYLLNKYIENIEINGQKFNLNIGLNAIIGRRSAGKSYLLNSIVKKLNIKMNTNNDKFTDKIKLEGKYETDKVLYLKQSQLAETFKEFIEKLGYEKSKDLDLIKKIFGDKYDRINYCIPILDLKKTKNNLKKYLIKILQLCYEIKKEKLEKDIYTYETEILKHFNKKIENAMNRKEIDKLNYDLKKTKNFNDDEDISPWLESKIKNIIKDLETFKNNFKYKEIPELSKILKEMNLILEQKNISSKTEKSHSELTDLKKKLKEAMILEKYNKFESFILSIKKFYQEVNQGEKYFKKDESVDSNADDSLSFLKFDIKLVNLEKKSIADFIWELIHFNLTKDLIPKKSKATTETISSILETKIITKIAGEDISNMSFGSQQEKFMQQILKINKNDIIILDQPDDDLDAITVKEQIINKIEKNYRDKQWIVVTHNPEIVVNSDARTIIMANYKSKFEKNESDYYEIDENSLIKNAHKVLDSKKQFPKIRWKRYERK